MDLKDMIGVYPNSLSKEFCDELILDFQAHKLLHSPGMTASGYRPGYKNTLDLDLLTIPALKEKCDVITSVANKNVDDYVSKFPNPEGFNNADYLFYGGTYYPIWQLQYYEKENGHFSSWHTEGEVKEFWNRIFAVMFYLNDVEEGGETEFPLQDLVFKPKAGTFLIWPAPWPFVHRGNVPLSNDKYILTTWLLRKG